jgi:hypothetical protein
MKTLLILLLTTFLWADYLVAWKQDGTVIKGVANPQPELLVRLDNSDYGYMIFADKATADLATTEQRDAAIATALANQSLADKNASKWIRAVIKTIAFYEGVPVSEVRQRVESNLP